MIPLIVASTPARAVASSVRHSIWNASPWPAKLIGSQVAYVVDLEHFGPRPGPDR